MHRDSLGTEIPIRPGAMNLMSAGRGIVHSERTGQEARLLVDDAILGSARRDTPFHEARRGGHARGHDGQPDRARFGHKSMVRRRSAQSHPPTGLGVWPVGTGGY